MPAPTRGQRALGWLVDKVALGNNYNPTTGKYTNVGRGLLGRGGQVLAGYLGGPLAAQAAKQFGQNFADTGKPFDFSQNGSRIGDLINAFAQNQPSSDGGIGPVTRQPINFPGLGLLAPSFGNSAGIPTMPPVVATAPQGQPNLGTGAGLFGGARPNFGQSVSVPRAFGTAAGSFTPWGAGVIQNDEWGAAASGMGVGGMSGGSRDSPLYMPAWARE